VGFVLIRTWMRSVQYIPLSLALLTWYWFSIRMFPRLSKALLCLSPNARRHLHQILTLLFVISCRRIQWNLSRCDGFWLSGISNKPMDPHWVLPGAGSWKYYRSLLRMDSLPFPHLDMSNFVPLGFIWPYPSHSPYHSGPYGNKIRTNLH